jgi:hypothetical protein
MACSTSEESLSKTKMVMQACDWGRPCHPLIHGVRRKRVGPVSGLIITDGAGNERGGFTTNEVGEAFIGIDSEDEQQVLFLANPHGSVNFDLFDSKGNETQILVFPNGPAFTMKKAKQTVLELPR